MSGSARQQGPPDPLKAWRGIASPIIPGGASEITAGYQTCYATGSPFELAVIYTSLGSVKRSGCIRIDVLMH
jgi:hypothetical protein